MNEPNWHTTPGGNLVFNPSFQYQIYQVERALVPLTPAEQRAADDRNGELAADLVSFGRALVRAVTLAGPREAWRRRRSTARPAGAPSALATPVAAD